MSLMMGVGAAEAGLQRHLDQAREDKRGDDVTRIEKALAEITSRRIALFNGGRWGEDGPKLAAACDAGLKLVRELDNG
jgi:hypothetical protein